MQGRDASEQDATATLLSLSKMGREAISIPRTPMLPQVRQMLPTQAYGSARSAVDYDDHSEPPPKRVRLSPQASGSQRINNIVGTPSSESGHANLDFIQKGAEGVIRIPPSPLVRHDPSREHAAQQSASYMPSSNAEQRGLSIQSLLSELPGERSAASAGVESFRKEDHDGTFTYGYDHGKADLDIPRNDDSRAVTFFNPSSLVHHHRRNDLAKRSGLAG